MEIRVLLLLFGEVQELTINIAEIMNSVLIELFMNKIVWLIMLRK